jgi:hypothetical protein
VATAWEGGCLDAIAVGVAILCFVRGADWTKSFMELEVNVCVSWK